MTGENRKVYRRVMTLSTWDSTDFTSGEVHTPQFPAFFPGVDAAKSTMSWGSLNQARSVYQLSGGANYGNRE